MLPFASSLGSFAYALLSHANSFPYPQAICEKPFNPYFPARPPGLLNLRGEYSPRLAVQLGSTEWPECLLLRSLLR